MTSADLILRAADAGVTMTLGNAGLQLHADRPPPAKLLAELAAHKMEIIATLSAANETTAPLTTWLHLLVLADGCVIQRAGDLITAAVEESASQQYGDNLLAVVAVTGFERPLTEEEIVKALAGRLAAPASPPPPSSAWLARVARLLGTRPAELLEGGHLEQHDLIEQACTDTAIVADHIRLSPAWINRPQRIEQPVEWVVEDEVESQCTVDTVATATPEWREAPDQYINHLMACRACHAPLGRYCANGIELRQRYQKTDMEMTA